MTEREPTKSAVIGMLAAALGRRRTDSLSDLQNLRFGVRLDQPGELLRDFHTAAHPTDGKRKFISERFYLADAVFLVGIEAEPELLRILDEAVRHPVFPLYLGRRACPPEGRVSLGIREGKDLLTALATEDWQASAWYQKNLQRAAKHNATDFLEVVCDAQPGDQGVFYKSDAPISFSHRHRRHTLRAATSKWDAVPLARYLAPELDTEHDPFAEIID
jgi:CRISPR system Cascade subunit CasD